MVEEVKKIHKLTNEKLKEILGDEVSQMSKVVLSGRGIQKIDSISLLKNVKKLNMSDNKISRLSGFQHLTEVTMFKGCDNQLTAEGLEELRFLQKLVILNLASNNISQISINTLRHLRCLKALVLNNNRISSLDWLPRLPELNSLILSSNRISSVPTSFTDKLSNLTKISLSHNRFQECPDFSALEFLNEIRMSNNQIKQIPSTLANNASLKIVDFCHNEIDTWDGIAELGNVTTLKQFHLRGNPLCGVPLVKSKQLAIEEGKDEDSVVVTKEMKKLEAKNMQYNYQMKRLLPNLMIRDGIRVVDKKIHGYVAPKKEEKESRPLKKNKKKNSSQHDIDLTCKNEKNVLSDGKDKAPKSLKKAKKQISDIPSVMKDSVENSTVEETGDDKRNLKEKPASDNKRKNNIAVEGEISTKKKLKRHSILMDNDDDDLKHNHKSSTLEDKNTEVSKEKREKKEKKNKKEKKTSKIKEAGVVGVVHKKKNKTFVPVNLENFNSTSGVGSGGSSSWD